MLLSLYVFMVQMWGPHGWRKQVFYLMCHNTKTNLLERYHTVKPYGGVNMNRTVAFWLQLHHVATANWFEFYSLVSVNLSFWRRLVCSAWQQSPGANPWWAEHSVLWHSCFHQLWPEQHQPTEWEVKISSWLDSVEKWRVATVISSQLCFLSSPSASRKWLQ